MEENVGTYSRTVYVFVVIRKMQSDMTHVVVVRSTNIFRCIFESYPWRSAARGVLSIEYLVTVTREISGYWPRYTYTKIEGGHDLTFSSLMVPRFVMLLRDFWKFTFSRASETRIWVHDVFRGTGEGLRQGSHWFRRQCRAQKIPIDGFQLSSGYTAQPSKDNSNILKRCTMTWNFRDFLILRNSWKLICWRTWCCCFCRIRNRECLFEIIRTTIGLPRRGFFASAKGMRRNRT